MPFFYGDSTPSPLEINYVDFLRAAVEASVDIVRADEAISSLTTERESREAAAQELVRRIEELGSATIRGLEPAVKEDDPSNLRRLRDSIVKAAEAGVGREVAEVRRILTQEIDRNQTAIREQRRKAIRALENLIVHHDLPGAVGELHVALSPELKYTAGWLARTEYGVEVLVELEIPQDTAFVQDIRIQQLVDSLEIHAPETSGWLRKETKMAPQRVSKHHIVGVTLTPKRVKVMLRSSTSPESDGFNLGVDRAKREVEIARASGDDPVEQFEVDPKDVPALLDLTDKLAEETERLREHRRGLLDASLDGSSLDEHPRPSEIVERMMRSAGKVVREIAKHSPKGELVLRRMLGDNRREEIFVSKKELLDKIAALPAERQVLFAPLDLDPKKPQAVIVDDEEAEEADDSFEDFGREPTAVLLGRKRMAAADVGLAEAAEATAGEAETVPDAAEPGDGNAPADRTETGDRGPGPEAGAESKEGGSSAGAPPDRSKPPTSDPVS